MTDLEDSSTPAGYAKAVAAQARRHMNDSPFFGQIFKLLSERLDREHPTNGNQASVDVTIHVLPRCGNKNFKRLFTTQELDNLDTVVTAISSSLPDASPMVQILFLHGHQPPQCLTRVGARYKVNPRAYLRHLQYLWSNSQSRLFASPSLPSASVDIVSLCVVTLVQRKATGTSLEDMRCHAKLAMDKYLHRVYIGRGLNAGDSIVRASWIHSPEYFSVEQEITVSLQRKDGRWSLMIWTDIARELSSSPDDPWRVTATSKAARSSLLRNWLYGATIWKRPAQSELSTNMHKLHTPSLSSLRTPIPYGDQLDPKLMAADAFYCLSELFKLSAYSIDQLLKLIEGRIQESTGYSLSESQQTSHADLLYHQDILNRIRKRVVNCSSDIRHYRHSWPKTTNTQQRAQVDSVSDGLQQDFQDLQDRIDRLLTRCHEGMNMCMSLAAINGAEKARLQAERIGQLTWLAFFYTPLSFTTSFFGMNLADFGEKGGLPTYLWFAVSVPIVTISYLVLLLVGKYGKK